MSQPDEVSTVETAKARAAKGYYLAAQILLHAKQAIGNHATLDPEHHETLAVLISEVEKKASALVS